MLTINSGANNTCDDAPMSIVRPSPLSRADLYVVAKAIDKATGGICGNVFHSVIAPDTVNRLYAKRVSGTELAVCTFSQ